VGEYEVHLTGVITPPFAKQFSGFKVEILEGISPKILGRSSIYHEPFHISPGIASFSISQQKTAKNTTELLFFIQLPNPVQYPGTMKISFQNDIEVLPIFLEKCSLIGFDGNGRELRNLDLVILLIFIQLEKIPICRVQAENGLNIESFQYFQSQGLITLSVILYGPKKPIFCYVKLQTFCSSEELIDEGFLSLSIGPYPFPSMNHSIISKIIEGRELNSRLLEPDLSIKAGGIGILKIFYNLTKPLPPSTILSNGNITIEITPQWEAIPNPEFLGNGIPVAY